MGLFFPRAAAVTASGAASGGGGGGGTALSTGFTRESLLDTHEGYATDSVTGALDYTEATVTSLSESAFLTALGSGNRWVTFSPGLTGNLSIGYTELPSNVVIDGRGADITFTGSGPMVVYNNTSRVIISNFKFNHSGADQLFIRAEDFTGTGPRHVWLDHLAFTGSSDECIDISARREDISDSARPRYITMSYLLFDNVPGYSILAGSGDYVLNSPDFVTIHHTYFNHCDDRLPRTVAAKTHVFNCWWNSWGQGGAQRAVSASTGAHLRLENSIINAANAASNYFNWLNNSVTYENGNWKLNSPNVFEQNPGSIFTPPYSYTLDTADSALQTKIVNNAGWRNVSP